MHQKITFTCNLLATLVLMGCHNVKDSSSIIIAENQELSLNDESLEYEDNTLVLGNGVIYYLSTSGDDNNTGLSIDSPWKSLDKVSFNYNNGTGFTLQPGDSVLLKAGDTFEGGLTLYGNSTKENPITISSYGVGKPKINISKGKNGISINNCGGFVIDNLELVITASPLWGGSGSVSDGINITYDDPNGEFFDIVIQNCDIHATDTQMLGNGIRVNANFNWDHNIPEQEKSDALTNLTVRNNTIHNLGNVGFRLTGWNNLARVNYTGRHAFHNVQFTDNQVYQIGHLGAFFQCADSGLFARNYIYETGQGQGPNDWGSCGMMVLAVENIVIKNNIIRNSGNASAPLDAVGFDIDWSAFNTVLQYNESYDNEGSGIATMSNVNSKIINNKVYGNKSKYYEAHSQINLTDYSDDFAPYKSEGVQEMLIDDNLVIIDVDSTNGIGGNLFMGGYWYGNVITNNTIINNAKSSRAIAFKQNASVETIDYNRYYYPDITKFIGQIEASDIYGWANWQNKHDKNSTLTSISEGNKPVNQLSELTAAYDKETHTLNLEFLADVPNFWHYNVHLAKEENFTPNYINLLDWVKETNYQVKFSNLGTYYIAITAENYFGNVSLPTYIKVVIE